MYKSFFTVFVWLLLSNVVFGQYYEDKDVSTQPVYITKRFETETWKTAFTVPERELHLSVFAPTRYGISPSVELQSHLALWAYLTPNLYLKKNWYEDRWVLSSKHGVYYPTQGLKILRKDNEDSTLDETAEVPHILTLQNELIASYIINPSCNSQIPYWIATARLGMDFSLTGDRKDSFNRMTFYSLYHRTASFYGDKVLYMGGQIDGGLWKHIYFSAGADIYAIDFDVKGLEAQGSLIYHYSQKLSFSGGFKYIRTNNEIEKESHLFPTVDICYRLWRKGEREKGLFRK